MSDEIVNLGHVGSGGIGAILTLALDRVIRFFTERDRRREELEVITQLAEIKATLQELKGRDALIAQVARLEARLEMLMDRPK